jgi:RHS repeat-associated protein
MLHACSNTGHRVHFYPTEYLTYGNGGSALITTRPDGKAEYKIVDHLGSTRVVLNDMGAVLSQYDYEPFGKPLAKTGLDSRKSYIDKEKDYESGLGNYGVRSYDDWRFTSIDPLWEKYRAWSPYQYSANNPVKLTDGNGLFWATDHNNIDIAAYNQVYGKGTTSFLTPFLGVSTFMIESIGFATNALHLDNMDNSSMSSFLNSGGLNNVQSHTLQDFYSHSNYVEIMLENGYTGSNIPTFDELDKSSDIYKTLLSKIETTKHPDSKDIINGHDGNQYGKLSDFASGKTAVPLSSSNFMAKDANGSSHYDGFKHPLYSTAYNLALRATVHKLERQKQVCDDNKPTGAK